MIYAYIIWAMFAVLKILLRRNPKMRRWRMVCRSRLYIGDLLALCANALFDVVIKLKVC